MLRDAGKEKDAARVKAMQLFPQVADQLSRKKDHGRADALLICAWAQRIGIVAACRMQAVGDFEKKQPKTERAYAYVELR